MGTITDNSNLHFLFSDNAEPVNLDLKGGEYPVLLCRDYTTQKNVEFRLPATDRLEIRNLLNAAPLEQPTMNFDTAEFVWAATSGNDSNATLAIKDASGNTVDSLDYLVLKGGIAGRTSKAASRKGGDLGWLTQRPQQNRTCRWGREALFLRPIEAANFTVVLSPLKVLIKCYTVSGGAYTATVYESSAVPAGIIGISVDFAKVEAKFKKAGVSAAIAAYDVWVEATGAVEYTSNPVRFVVDDGKADYRGFVYRNALGTFDTVYSRGGVRIVPEYEVQSFINNLNEKELDTNAVEHVEIDTGAFGSSADRMMWLDFLRSTEKYVIEPDGTVASIVLDESGPEIALKAVNSISFKYHKSAVPVGNGFAVPLYASSLDAFSIEGKTDHPYGNAVDPIVPSDPSGNEGGGVDLSSLVGLGFSGDVLYKPTDKYPSYISLLQADGTYAAEEFPTKTLVSGSYYNMSVKLKSHVQQLESTADNKYPLAIAGMQYANMKSGKVLPVYYSSGVSVNPKRGILYAADFVRGGQSLSDLYAPKAHKHTISDITDAGSLLDGIDSLLDTYAAKAHTHTVSQITDFPSTWPWSGITGKPTTLEGYGITDWVLRYENAASPDTFTTAGIYRVQTQEGTDGFNYGNVLVVRGAASDTIAQLAFPYNSDNIVFRRGTTASFTSAPWTQIWTSGNDGAGSGLDADLLDGKHLSEIFANVDSCLRINPSTGDFTEGIRIRPYNGWTSILLGGTDLERDYGTSPNSWSLHTYDGRFYLNRGASYEHTGYELCNVNGNWGVATNSPDAKLTVAGTARISGLATLDGGLSVPATASIQHGSNYAVVSPLNGLKVVVVNYEEEVGTDANTLYVVRA